MAKNREPEIEDRRILANKKLVEQYTAYGKTKEARDRRQAKNRIYGKLEVVKKSRW